MSERVGQSNESAESVKVRKLPKDERAKIEREYEAVRAPIGNLADAARRAANAGENLEWALLATDPRTDWNKGDFNHEYAERQLVEATELFPDLLGDLRTVLETEAERITHG